MRTGILGTFVIPWSQVELDGLSGRPAAEVSVGSVWRWNGSVVRVDGPGSVLVLSGSAEAETLRRHASRSASRVLDQVGVSARAVRLPEPDEPVVTPGFSLTDGLRRYTATLIERQDAPPLCMFQNEVPPPGRDLWITHLIGGLGKTVCSVDRAPSVICFTPGTRIATPDGARRAGDLCEGDLVLTKDDGPQPVRWIGQRWISGARLHAMTDLRPIRIRAGGVALGIPNEDLLVSPQHRLLVRGDRARALFGTDEVLVAARDLVDDHAVMVDLRLREVTYVHLLLDRHSIVFANGLEAESFHPASMDLGAVDRDQMDRLTRAVPGVDRDPSLYGAFARRMLSASEAAILRHKAGRPH